MSSLCVMVLKKIMLRMKCCRRQDWKTLLICWQCMHWQPTVHTVHQHSNLSVGHAGCNQPSHFQLEPHLVTNFAPSQVSTFTSPHWTLAHNHMKHSLTTPIVSRLVQLNKSVPSPFLQTSMMMMKNSSSNQAHPQEEEEP